MIATFRKQPRTMCIQTALSEHCHLVHFNTVGLVDEMTCQLSKWFVVDVGYFNKAWREIETTNCHTASVVGNTEL